MTYKIALRKHRCNAIAGAFIFASPRCTNRTRFYYKRAGVRVYRCRHHR